MIYHTNSRARGTAAPSNSAAIPARKRRGSHGPTPALTPRPHRSGGSRPLARADRGRL